MSHRYFRWVRAQRTQSSVSRQGGELRKLRLEALEDRRMLAVDLVSQNFFNGGSANNNSSNPTVSLDGRFTVFESQANDLVQNLDNNGVIGDVYRRDNLTGVVQLVSVNFANNGAGVTASGSPAISADGRYVAFVSGAANLVTVPVSGQHVFVRDMAAGTTQLASINVGNIGANGISGSPSISRDGRYVAFVSNVVNLVTNDTNGSVQDVFVRDRVANTTALVSRNFAGTGSGNGASGTPVISGNGLFVAFSSQATDLVTGINDFNANGSDVFARNLAAGTTQLISINNAGTLTGNSTSSGPSISDDGQWVAFASVAADLVPNDSNGAIQDVFARNRVTNVTVLVSRNLGNTGSGNQPSGAPVISRDGSTVAFLSQATNLTAAFDANASQNDVFAFRLATLTQILVSASANPARSGNFASSQPTISLTGRYVGFASTSNDLTTNDTNSNTQDVFRRDITANVTWLISLNSSATGSGAGISNNGSISDDGQSLAFVSAAVNLTPNTNSPFQHVYLSAFSNNLLVTGAGQGGGPHVRVLDARNGNPKIEFFAYPAGFSGGVRVAMGDVDGNGIPDVVTAAGPGGGPHVRVFNAVTGAPLAGPIGSFFAYGAAFAGGVNVATGDFNGDNRDDIVTGADAGGGPHVRVFNALNGAVIREFFAYGAAFTGGVRVAAGDVTGDGIADIVTGAGPGGGPDVRVFNGATGALVRAFFAFTAGFTGGVYVSVGDVNGDGRGDLIVGAGPGGGPHVKVFSGLDNSLLRSFFAFEANFAGGVRVASGDINIDGNIDVIAATGPGAQGRVRTFRGNSSTLINDSLAYNGFAGGVYVAAFIDGAVGGSPILAPPASSSLASSDGLTEDQLAAAVAAAFASGDPWDADKLHDPWDWID